MPRLGNILKLGLDARLGTLGRELALLDRRRDRLAALGPRLKKVCADEAADVDALRDDVEVVVQVDGRVGRLVTRDRTALRDAREARHLGKDVVQDLAANVVKVEVDEIAPKRLVEVVLPRRALVVEALVGSERFDPLALVGPPRDTDNLLRANDVLGDLDDGRTLKKTTDSDQLPQVLASLVFLDSRSHQPHH